MKKKIIILTTIFTILMIAIIAVLLQYFLIYLPEKKEKELWHQMYNEFYAGKLESFREENKSIENIDVVFIGDSLTEGYDLKSFYPEYNVLNRGISGDTTDGLKGRLNVSVYAANPKVVVMLIGANNFDTMLNDYENIVIDLKTNLPDTKIVLLSLTAMSKEWGKNNTKAIENNKVIKQLSQKYNCEFIDLFNPLIDPSTNELYESYTIDGGHLTTHGYSEITKIIKPVLDELLTNGGRWLSWKK